MLYSRKCAIIMTSSISGDFNMIGMEYFIHWMIQWNSIHWISYLYDICSGRNLEIRNCNLEITNIRKIPLHYLKIVVQFLHDNHEIRDFISECIKIYSHSFNDFYINLFKWKIIFLFKTFKKYLRSIMKLKRLNHIATLYIYWEMVDKLNIWKSSLIILLKKIKLEGLLFPYRKRF